MLFEVRGGSVSVLFRKIFLDLPEDTIFLRFGRLFRVPGSISHPKWVSLGCLGASFWSYFGDVLAA